MLVTCPNCGLVTLSSSPIRSPPYLHQTPNNGHILGLSRGPADRERKGRTGRALPLDTPDSSNIPGP